MKNLKLKGWVVPGLLATVLTTVILVSCISNEGRGPGPGGQGGPGGGGDSTSQGPGRPSEAEGLLMQLKGLSEVSSGSSLALSSDQRSSLMPVLKDWQTAGSAAQTKEYTQKIETILTSAQKSYRPGPPQGAPGQGGPGQGGSGQGPGQPPSTDSLLKELIKALG